MLPYNFNSRNSPDSDCKGSVSYMAFASCIVFSVLLLGFYTMRATGKINILYVEQQTPILFKTDERFLSVALDSSVIANGFKNFNMSDPKLLKIIAHLSPAYLRIGGNMADRLIFAYSKKTYFKMVNDVEPDGGDCSNTNCNCEFHDKPNFTMNGFEWLRLNNLTKATKLDMVFDLNVLRRLSNDSWDSENAEKLIKYSNDHHLNVDWQLGNEPNAFQHQFNYAVNATQLAADFHTLRTILDKYPQYACSLLIGPDTTRPDPKNKKSTMYLAGFLRNAGDVIDIISWHQYYFNGRTVEAQDFLDPTIFDVLLWQINVIKKIQNWTGLSQKKLWLAETSSAWGGGSPRFSDRFIACFIWLDKLGLSARMGIDVVVRQSIFNGYYALISDDYTPNPDYWVSILYKKLVGREVLSCYNITSKKVRLYCHCSSGDVQVQSFSSVTVYGMNMGDTPAKIRIEGFVSLAEETSLKLKLLSYTLTTKESLLNRDVYLNGEILKLTSDYKLPTFKPKILDARPYVTIPPYSIVFWVIPTKSNICDIRE